MRSFAVCLVILAALMFPFWQEARSAQIEPVGIVTDTPNEVYRRYAVPESDVGPVFDGKVMSLYAFGYVADSDEEAKEEFRSIVALGPRTFETITEETEAESGVNVSVSGYEEVEIATLGEESRAWVYPSKYGKLDVEFGMTLIRDGAWIQMLTTVAFNTDGQTVRLLETVASAAKDRWPNESAVKVRPDGVRYGGIWALAVLPDDVPQHLLLDKSFDEGPGPGALSSFVEPSPTLTPLPLVPTQPAGGKSVPTQSSDSSTRLAQPFDATVRIILANGTFSADSEGQCTGSGRYSYLRKDGLATLKTVDGVEDLVIVRGLTPGYVSYDLQLHANVCVFEVQFQDVPPRAGYLLLAGDVPITRFTYEELSSGNLVEIVVEH